MTAEELRRDAMLMRDHGCVADGRLLLRAASELDRLTMRVSELEEFCCTLWKHSRDLAQQTSECDQPENAEWGRELMDTAKRLGIEAKIGVATNTESGL